MIVFVSSSIYKQNFIEQRYSILTLFNFVDFLSFSFVDFFFHVYLIVYFGLEFFLFKSLARKLCVISFFHFPILEIS